MLLRQPIKHMDTLGSWTLERARLCAARASAEHPHMRITHIGGSRHGRLLDRHHQCMRPTLLTFEATAAWVDNIDPGTRPLWVARPLRKTQLVAGGTVHIQDVLCPMHSN